jgi:hypothetical protein
MRPLGSATTLFEAMLMRKTKKSAAARNKRKTPISRAIPDGAPTASQGRSPSHSKLDKILELVTRPSGATLDDLVEATGWQKHSVRAAITKISKSGIVTNLSSTREADGHRRYCASAIGAGLQEKDPRNG